MIVNKDSWHYKLILLSKGLSYISWDPSLIKRALEDKSVSNYFQLLVDTGRLKMPTNFCQYWRSVLISPLVVLTLNMLGLGVIISLIALVPVSDLILGIAILVAGIALVAIIMVIYIGAEEIREKIIEIRDTPDSFFGNIYNQYKNNICTIMEYKK